MAKYPYDESIEFIENPTVVEEEILFHVYDGVELKKIQAVTIDKTPVFFVELIHKASINGTGIINCKMKDFVKNLNSGRSVKAIVETKWFFNKQEKRDYSVFDVPPGGEIFVGCSEIQMGIGCQTFKRRIVGAEYL